MWRQIADLPSWAYQTVWTSATVSFFYLLGRFASRHLGRRFLRWAKKTAWKWDDIVAEALQRGIPFWVFLIGCHISLNYWQFSEQWLSSAMRVLNVAAWLSVTWIAAGTAGRFVLLYGSQFEQQLPMTSITQQLAQIGVVLLGLLMVLNAMGISIAPLLTALGVGGLAVALALQDTLSNLFAGFYLTMSRHVRVGDYIKLDSGQEGFVHDIGWRATQIRMLPNNMVIVPNNKLSQAIITNFDLPSHDMAVTAEVGVDYGSDMEKVERVTGEVGREVMKTVVGGVPDFEPFIRFHTFGDYSIQFTVILRSKTFVDQYLVKHEFIKRLTERYRKEGIVIPFPIQTVFRRDD